METQFDMFRRMLLIAWQRIFILVNHSRMNQRVKQLHHLPSILFNLEEQQTLSFFSRVLNHEKLHFPYQLKWIFPDNRKDCKIYHLDNSQDSFCCMECILFQSHVRIAFVFLDSILSLRNCWRMNHSLGAYFGSGEEIMMWCGLTTAFVYSIGGKIILFLRKPLQVQWSIQWLSIRRIDWLWQQLRCFSFLCALQQEMVRSTREQKWEMLLLA